MRTDRVRCRESTDTGPVDLKVVQNWCFPRGRSPCVFFPFILDIKFVGRTNRGHTGFLIHLPSAVRALIFSREGFSHSFPSSTVKSNFVFYLSSNDFEPNRSPLVGPFFFFLVRKIPFTGIRTHIPTCQKVTRLLLSYRGMDQLICASLSRTHWVTHEEGHTEFLTHLPSALRALIFSREGFSHSFPSSTMKSNFVY